MKKTILFLFLITFSFGIKAQCNISGPLTVMLGTSATFSIPNLAQCTECYDWDTLSSNISITSSDMNNTVIISANSLGQAHLQVTYFDEEGCHTCDILFDVINGDPAGCCEPELNSYFICGGWKSYGGHGAIYIAFPECDRTTVSSIDWVVNGANFISGPLTGSSSGTTYGPGSPGNIDNLNCSVIQVQATVHYNNGCLSETLNETIIPSSRVSENIIYPNPTSSEIKINLDSIKNKENITIKVIDIDSNQEVYNKRVSRLKDSNEITIGGLSKYRIVQVIILNNGKIVNQSKIMIK
ncbi:MAG: hypothetical protein COA88_07395 [Kordia sp.]|nr:MAG: hypothetical protein COA88_07395 [Kordia sp.]